MKKTILLVGFLFTCAAAQAAGPCAVCHADVVAEFSLEAHGRALATNDEGGTCVACHGEADEHLAAPGAASIQSFADLATADSNAVCTGCHTDIEQSSISPHRGSVACTDCHSIHGEHATDSPIAAEFKDLNPGSSTCVACHADTFTQFSFNEGHRLAQGAVDCTSCHDAHAPTASHSLGGFSQETCSTCHADKDGPFVFEHGASRVEGCSGCHEPHGSPNRHMLTHQETGELCYSCHALVPQFHLGFAPSAVAPARFDERSVCTNCHVTIHGSNLDRLFLR